MIPEVWERIRLYSRKNLKISLACLIIAAFTICLVIPPFASVDLSLGQDEYTYYGVVPSDIWRYFLADWNATLNAWMNRDAGWVEGIEIQPYYVGSVGINGKLVATKAMLAIAASEDNTNVKVYDLRLGTVLDQGILNSMEKRLVLLANGTQFKVVSDKIVSVELLNYQIMPSASVTEGPIPHTFYTDVNGLYVGKEFILMASEQPGVTSGGTSAVVGGFYTIFALEPSTVTVTRDDNTEHTYTLGANEYDFLLLTPFRVYKFESTGSIMIQSGTISNKGNAADTACFAVPSAQGGFVGTTFYTRSLKSQEWGWDPLRDYGYRIMALEDAHVSVYDLETQQVLMEVTVSGGSGTTIQPVAEAIAVQSDRPITLTQFYNGSIERGSTGGGWQYAGYVNGMMFITIQPNEDTMVQLPTEAYVKAYFFTSEETQLTLDTLPLTIHANTPYEYTMPGTHVIRADHNVILQINFWPNEPENQGLWFRGTAIPCIETVNLNPDVTLTPLGGGFPMMYIMIGAAVAAVVVIAGFLVMRRRGAKPS
jgi:hypothetical protein